MTVCLITFRLMRPANALAMTSPLASSFARSLSTFIRAVIYTRSNFYKLEEMLYTFHSNFSYQDSHVVVDVLGPVCWSQIDALGTGLITAQRGVMLKTIARPILVDRYVRHVSVRILAFQSGGHLETHSQRLPRFVRFGPPLVALNVQLPTRQLSKPATTRTQSPSVL